LCRLLRDEVIEQMGRGSPGLTGLAQDWRKLLFPQADDAKFADGYAQAVTFGLLVGRARNIPLSGGTERAAHELRRSNSLIGTALRLLTDKPEGAWAEFPDLDQLFSKSFLGVMPGRTWVIAPDVDSLLRRWSALTRERNADRKELLFHPH